MQTQEFIALDLKDNFYKGVRTAQNLQSCSQIRSDLYSSQKCKAKIDVDLQIQSTLKNNSVTQYCVSDWLNKRF